MAAGSIICIVRRHLVCSVCAEMSPGDPYRKLAAELRAKAKHNRSAQVALEMEHLALCYLRLADQAENNRFQDAWCEFGPPARLDGEGEGA
jgi:hypothetical protein